jgi:predicted nucleic acid-binding protein
VRWLVDANVILDVLADREPWAEHSVRVLESIEEGRAEGFVAAHTITTLHYLVASHRGRDVATSAVRRLLRLFEVVPVDEDRLLHALDLGLADFEDAVQAACAEKARADALVTRNEDDFRGVGVPVLSPVAALAGMGGEA